MMRVKPFFPLLLLTALSTGSMKVYGQEAPSKTVKDGWAVHLGAGYLFGGNLGVLGERQILLKEQWRISPFAAVGVAEGGTDSTGSSYYWWGASAGANLEFGKKHRLVFGPQFVWQDLIGSSVEVKRNPLTGLSFILGYKGTAAFGLIWQVYIGDIYIQEPTDDSNAYSHYSHVGLGFGYKF